MAHRVLINGTGYSVKGGRTVINGTGYSVKGGRTVINGTAYPIRFAKALHSLPIGSSVFLNVGGVRTEFLVIHRGNPDPSVYDASCDGVWLLMKEAGPTVQWSTTTSIKDSIVQNYLNNEYLSKLDANIQNVIKQVKIPYRTEAGNPGVKMQGANGLSCKLFLLSVGEVNYRSSYKLDYSEGAALNYFSSGEDASRIAYQNGAPTAWWLRSPNCYETYGAGYVHMAGHCQIAHHTASAIAIRPACILPPTVTVDDGLDLIF